MSVQTQIDRIKANIAIAYAKAQEKGAELPAVQNSENLPVTIEAIPVGSLPEGLRTIAVTADPPGGGSVSGGGVAQDGMTVTVSAEENVEDNYFFAGWKKNGAVISEERIYAFPVAEDISLIASFAEALYVSGAYWWTAETLPSSGWTSVTYGDSKFVAVGGSKAAYSTDGIRWTTAAIPSSSGWTSVTYGDGKFVAVAGNSDKAAYSTDGFNWTETTLPSSDYWSSVTYGDGKFVAVASYKAAYSTDGINWIAATNPPSFGYGPVTYGDGKFVAAERRTRSNSAAYSTDGVNWTAATLPPPLGNYYVAYGGRRFVAVGIGSNKVAYSSASGPAV